jgi:hypothetical protein
MIRSALRQRGEDVEPLVMGVKSDFVKLAQEVCGAGVSFMRKRRYFGEMTENGALKSSRRSTV